jgi:SAM-dependent methyltransferase
VAETNRESILEQYADQGNLAARQSIYRFARPGTPDFFGWALQLARLDGKERVLDICCGNGNYLKALAAGGHRGAVHGLDLSAGMVAAAAAARADQGLVVGDAQALPFADQTADVALCMHALYHVPDQEAAVAEVRRVVRRGHGRALFVTNAVGHVRQMDDLVADVAGARPLRAMLAFTMDDGEAVLRTAFERVESHRFESALDVTDPEAVVAYVTSTRGLYGLAEADRYDAVVAHVRRRVGTVIRREGVFTVDTASGCFVCS